MKISIRKFKIIYENSSRLTDICSYYLVVQQDWDFAEKMLF